MEDFFYRLVFAFLTWMVSVATIVQVGAPPIFLIAPAVITVALLVKPARQLPGNFAALFRVLRGKF